MTYVFPDFYFDFKCTASRCSHSCCLGWEIDIDEDSIFRYECVPGEFGKRLKDAIEMTPTPHFRLGKDERCPFLNKDNLCDIFINLGEDALCDICTDHPRFFNYYDSITEAGIGLCCEEAVRLLLDGSGPLDFVSEGGKPERMPAEIKERSEIFDILANHDAELSSAMDNAVRHFGGKAVKPEMRDFIGFLLTLEELDKSWGAMLKALCKSDVTDFTIPAGIKYERIAEYFIYRHFASGFSKKERLCRLIFAFLSTALICTLTEHVSHDLPETLRMFSSEIEYSDENIDKILVYIARKVL